MPMWLYSNVEPLPPPLAPPRRFSYAHLVLCEFVAWSWSSGQARENCGCVCARVLAASFCFFIFAPKLDVQARRPAAAGARRWPRGRLSAAAIVVAACCRGGKQDRGGSERRSALSSLTTHACHLRCCVCVCVLRCTMTVAGPRARIHARGVDTARVSCVRCRCEPQRVGRRGESNRSGAETRTTKPTHTHANRRCTHRCRRALGQWHAVARVRLCDGGALTAVAAARPVRVCRRCAQCPRTPTRDNYRP